MINRIILKIFSLIFVYSTMCCFIVDIPTANATDDDVTPAKKIDWPFDGVRGKFDKTSIQRGFKVYKEVCSACHSVNYLTFRNLSAIGYSEDQIKSIASEYSIKDGPNEEGEMYTRPGKPSDHIPGPYPNENAARAANNGAYPPDLSLIVKARKDGANYVYSLLTGYEKEPTDFQLGANMYYNPYFAGGGRQLVMPPPLVKDGQVNFDDGTEATVDQMAYDVVNFLQWVAEPEMEERKSLGIRAIIFVTILTVLFYILKRRIWKKVR